MSPREPGDDGRRDLPSIDQLLRSDEAATGVERWGREAVAQALRETLAEVRDGLVSGSPAPDPDRLLAAAFGKLSSDRPSLRLVLNATGVILHTNLGRAPLFRGAARAAAEVASGYSNLEYDLGSGERGDRYAHCTHLVSRLTGSESSLIVNNNAAAVSLAINTMALGRDVIVSRGELVEIGGGFRIPDVIERSGAFLRAVGSTNRVRVDDYQRAITPSTGLLLKVHPSNFRVEGFAEEATLESLVALGRASDLPVMHDLGSGLLAEETLPMLQEPSVRTSVAAGAELVTWSGDKLLGGPQAGIIDGRATTMERLRSNPLLRAFRVDKMTLAALETTLRSYLATERALVEIPVLRMLGEPAEEVERRAGDTMELLSAGAARHISVAPMRSVLGGGSAPGFEIASAGWVVSGPAMVLESTLRQQDPPVVGRITEGELHLDFRTIFEEQQRLLAAAVDRLFAKEDTE